MTNEKWQGVIFGTVEICLLRLFERQQQYRPNPDPECLRLLVCWNFGAVFESRNMEKYIK